ncbi:MAG TPA: ABC transporter ATP-binding protein [Solirubrobacterales bacterium]|nr:ABC transporter ATP-binding protein [Solirubrobacterales bacterium]
MTVETPAVEAVDLTRSYEAGMHAVRGLDGVSLTVAAGEIVAVMGPSGSGKSTLLSLLGGLDKPDSGSARIAGVDWQTMKGAERARFRRRACGFVAQGLTLLPQATAAENVEVPLLLDGRAREERRSAVADALRRVGLEGHASKMPDQLSGGEQQRAAIARALIGRPAVVLADEPTGNLDSATGQSVMELLTEAASAQGAAVVLVTHDPAVAKHARRTVVLHSGRLDATRAAPDRRGAGK